MQNLVVIALGGNALLRFRREGGKAASKPQNQFTEEQELRNARSACMHIRDIARLGYRMVLTHGNGPQVGDILIQQHLARGKVPEMTLDVCGAQTQGEIGYMLQSSLRPLVHRPVVTMLTQVIVDPKDPAFSRPSKFIGPFFNKPGPGLKKDSDRGYRKVVPSPEPKEIVEAGEIGKLVREGFIVIACGGGGIPVFRTRHGFRGAGAVIDKDLASERLATSLRAEILLILTDVDCAYRDYGTHKKKALRKISVKEAERLYGEGQFPPGSMGPKVLAATRFIRHGGKRAIITIPGKAVLALKGKAGTEIAQGHAE
jgi:carbamate kinase